MENRNIAYFSGGEAWLEPDGILRCFFYKETKVTLQIAQELHKAFLSLNQDMKRPVLSDVRNLRQIHREARQFFDTQAVHDVVLANAVVVNSLLTQTVVNLFTKMSQPPYPLRTFADEEAALAWLQTFVPPNRPKATPPQEEETTPSEGKPS
ncbi:MAG: hypothetical protein EP343_16280 [Deltaproteobacteria bacterium]|nr:MAG: hypothetical protein EP343_16280 [Deltaproteobacteria bacterium]